MICVKKIVVYATFINNLVVNATNCETIKMAKCASFGRLISSINQNLSIYIDAKLYEDKIGAGQIAFLTALQNEDGVNQEALTTKLGVDKATTARAVAKLVKEGYVTRKRDETDNRAYKLHLTHKGHEIKPKIKNVLQGLTEILSAGLTQQERATVMLLLEKMYLNILAENKKQKKATL